jgi:hypothetical protein
MATALVLSRTRLRAAPTPTRFGIKFSAALLLAGLGGWAAHALGVVAELHRWTMPVLDLRLRQSSQDVRETLHYASTTCTALVLGVGWLFRRRPFAGILSMAVGLFLLGALMFWSFGILPPVERTQSSLEVYGKALADFEQKRSAFPPPDHGNLNTLKLIPDGHGWALDGFERPFKYEVSTMWLVRSYRLTSLGFDGVPSADDQCVSGSNRLGSIANKMERAAQLYKLVKEALKHDTDLTVSDWLDRSKLLRCRQYVPNSWVAPAE